MRGRRSGGSYLGLFSFIAVMLLGLGIFLGWLLPVMKVTGNIASVIKQIAIAIALIVPLIYSYYEARRHGTVWFVLWVIATILVVVFYILGAIGIGF